ncbi:Phosphatidylinositol-4-phosphate 5-kinase protein [Dioscorea alata]|uniref:Phosphatidylinositol-4-phosphate 5-kinase protein n=1 Tax=Dioscorea alata TaxID=55571 RepID=A0ACB7UD61_DIOAL|nr:Phosphatidylinositol-4-phosphate 5-kinase protein [Dioscorea alata]
MLLPLRSLLSRYLGEWKMGLSGPDYSSHDFKTTTTTSIRLAMDGSSSPGVTFTDFELINYCPDVFRSLQDFAKVDSDAYMLSVYGNETLRKIASPWKCSSPIHFSQDHKFIIKIIRKSEMKVFLDMLPKYYGHARKYPNTLLTKIFGLHVVKPVEGPKVRFVVTGNILNSDLCIHKRFNLKGSSQGRGLTKGVGDDNAMYKDVDLDVVFHLDRTTRAKLLEQIMHDCDFLEGIGVMDYSLLVGMHIRHASTSDLLPREQSSCNVGSVDTKRKRSDSHSSVQSDFDQDLSSTSDMQSNYSYEEHDDRLGVRTPARAVKIQKIESGGLTIFRNTGKEEPSDVILYFEIIDILQGYNMVKRVEHVFKSLQFDAQSISAVNPNYYSTRFQDFLSKVFPENHSLL